MDNFIVSARKYRPVTFASVVGQGHITSTLKNAIDRGQLAHAYLFCGPRGVGKTTCARIFAKAINCQNPVSNEACGECESCRSFNEGRSFNIHELDAASNNSVDDIRTLTEQVRIPPQIGRYSVYIIDEVHMLSNAAFNAFLKTLEEPPAHAVFILATTEKHKIIPTILSRCQIYDFNRIRVEDGVQYLRHIASQEDVTADDESLNLIARKADGGMRDALSMFDKAVAFCGRNLVLADVARTLNILDYDTYFRVAEAIRQGDYKGALLIFDEVLGKGFSGHTFISGLGAHFRDLLMCKDPSTLTLLEVAGSLLDKYRAQSAQFEIPLLFDAIGIIGTVDNTYKAATNQRLHVELGLMKLCGLGQKKNDVGASGHYPLPPLVKETANAPAPAREPAQPAATPPAAPAQQHTATTPAQPAANQPEQETAAPAAPLAPKSAEASTAAKPAAEARKNGMTAISGVSLSSILNDKRPAETTEAAKTAATEGPVIDPDSEEKILAAKDDFLEILNSKRPRFATAFSTMEVSGHVITVYVSTEVLKEDIVVNQKEVYNILRNESGIEGTVEFNVLVKEDKTAVKPIRPEDKLVFMREKNPLLDTLRAELDLEIE